MTYNIEFIGAPGSGKSYIYVKLLNDLKKRGINVFLPRDVLIKDFLKLSQNISYLNKIAYYFYFKKFKINSNKLFFKEYKTFINYIKNSIIIDKNLRIILKIYKKYLSTTNYSAERKKRMSMNFLMDYLILNMNHLILKILF